MTNEAEYTCENENCRHVMKVAYIKNQIYQCPKCKFSMYKTNTIPASSVKCKTPAPMESVIRKICGELADFLVEKNRAYGNSAAEPCSIFAKRCDALAGIDVRIDDKINRIKKGSEFPGDDTIKDLAGYLILRMCVTSTGKELSK